MKSAEPDPALTSWLQNQAVLDAARLGVAGLGIGFGTRSLIALAQQAQRNASGPNQKAHQHARFVSPPIDIPPEPKVAGVMTSIKKFLQGGSATTPGGVPWRMPAMAGALGLGLVGGYQGADQLADRYYQSELDEELKKEREAFESALKGDGTSKLAAKIDELFDLVKASFLDNLGDDAGWATGLYGLYAGGAGLTAGKYMFDRTMKQRRINKINKALKQRRLLLQQQRPTPILVSDIPPDLEEV